MSARCVFCTADIPHARHVSVLEAEQLGIMIIDVRSTDRAGTEHAVTEAVTTVTSQPAPEAPQE